MIASLSRSVVPAKAGTHLSVARMPARWIPAFAGMTFLLLGCLAPSVAAERTSDRRVLHILDRLAFGPTAADVKHVKAIGIDRYIAEQQARRQRARLILEQAQAARIWRALYSPRQLQEVMVDFWFNHFNVFANKALDRLWIGAYEREAIRPHALGRFRDLLGATAHHPTMLFYLDNAQNAAPGSKGPNGRADGINENYARELMELHTLGADGGYTQDDVVALARILTGWGLA